MSQANNNPAQQQDPDVLAPTAVLPNQSPILLAQPLQEARAESGLVQPIQDERVSIKPPQFWRVDLKLWQIQLEAQFQIANVVQDTTKYNYVISTITTDIPQIITQVADFVVNPPVRNKYEEIKARLIDIYSDSNEKKLRKLLNEVSLGDKKPLQLLVEMSRLGGTAISQEVMKTLWMQHLPTNIQSVLTASSDSLDSFARMADRISEIEQPKAYSVAQDNNDNLAAAIEKLTRQVAELKLEQRQFQQKRSKSPVSRGVSPSGARDGSGLCWYHLRFKEKARACKSPCNYQENDLPHH